MLLPHIPRLLSDKREWLSVRTVSPRSLAGFAVRPSDSDDGYDPPGFRRARPRRASRFRVLRPNPKLRSYCDGSRRGMRSYTRPPS